MSSVGPLAGPIPQTPPPDPVTPAMPSSPPPNPLMPLGSLTQFSAPPVYQDPKPIVNKPKGKGCGKIPAILLVIVVVVIVLVVAFLPGLPFNNTPPVSFPPVVSNPVSSPIGTPDTPAITEISYATIANDQTVRIYDKAKTELIIQLTNKNWSNLQISPNGELLSLLTTSSATSDDANLMLYNSADGKWKQATVFNPTTKGITGYVWADNQTILFTQDGWLHSYNNKSDEIVKVIKVDMNLEKMDAAAKRLMFVAKFPRESKPAVTKKVPDPKAPNPATAPQIDEIVQPAVIKNDNVFKITDLKGVTIKDFKIDDLVQFSGNYIIRDMHFATYNDEYIADLVGYVPDTGESTMETKKLILLNDGGLADIKLPLEDKFILIGYYDTDRFLLGLMSNKYGLTSIASWDYIRNRVERSFLATPLTDAQLLDSAHLYHSVQSKDLVMKVNLTEEIKGKPIKQIHWYSVGSSLNELTFAQDFSELIYYPR